MTRPHIEAKEQVAGLHLAAKCIREHGAFACDAPIREPLALILESAAEQIEIRDSALGLPVSYVLEIAGTVTGMDLGHNQ